MRNRLKVFLTGVGLLVIVALLAAWKTPEPVNVFTDNLTLTPTVTRDSTVVMRADKNMVVSLQLQSGQTKFSASYGGDSLKQVVIVRFYTDALRTFVTGQDTIVAALADSVPGKLGATTRAVDFSAYGRTEFANYFDIVVAKNGGAAASKFKVVYLGKNN